VVQGASGNPNSSRGSPAIFFFAAGLPESGISFLILLMDFYI
jgi:hypothetical protein